MPAFFFNDTATTEIYTLSLHDALPISSSIAGIGVPPNGRMRSSELWMLLLTARTSSRFSDAPTEINEPGAVPGPRAGGAGVHAVVARAAGEGEAADSTVGVHARRAGDLGHEHGVVEEVAVR